MDLLASSGRSSDARICCSSTGRRDRPTPNVIDAGPCDQTHALKDGTDVRSLRCLLVAFISAVGACGDRSHAAKTALQTTASESVPATTRPTADTSIIRSIGVASDAGDTASTRYGKHETPRRIASPECRPTGIALCVVDTAETLFSVDCCIADQRQTKWLVFAARDDSMQLFVESPANPFLTMWPNNAAGAGTETSGSIDASWMRARFPTAGTYVFTASLEAGGRTPYELRVAPVVARGASQPMGTAATLTLTAPPRSEIAVAPHAMIPDDTAALRRFAVPPGRYRVLLVRDTLYEACRLPCREWSRFTLRPGQSVTIGP